jgi:hypothetical protein
MPLHLAALTQAYLLPTTADEDEADLDWERLDVPRLAEAPEPDEVAPGAEPTGARGRLTKITVRLPPSRVLGWNLQRLRSVATPDGISPSHGGCGTVISVCRVATSRGQVSGSDGRQGQPQPNVATVRGTPSG